MMLDDCYKEKSKKTTNSGMLGTWDKSSGMGTSQVGHGILDMSSVGQGKQYMLMEHVKWDKESRIWVKVGYNAEATR